MADASRIPLIKPESLDRIPHLDAKVREQYKQGLANLWQTAESSPADSEAHRTAMEKIKVASQKLMAQLPGLGNRPGSAGQPRQNTQQQQQPQQQQGGMQQGSQQMAQQGGNMSAQQMAQVQAQAARNAQQQQAQRQGGQQGGQQNPAMSQATQQKIAAELDNTNVVQPQGMSDQQFQQLKNAWRKMGASFMQQRETAKQRAMQVQQQIQQAKSSGTSIGPQHIQSLENLKQAWSNQDKKWNAWKQLAENGNIAQVPQHIQNQQRPQTQQGQNSGQAQQGSPVAQQAQGQQQTAPPQQQQPDSKPVNGANSPSASQAQPNFQQQVQGNQNQQGGTSQAGQQTSTQQAPQQPPVQQQQTPQTATQTQPQPQGQAPQNFAQQQQQQQPLSNQQPRPQINTHQMHQSSSAGQQQGTPATNGVPHSASHQNQGQQRPLNTNEAIAQAQAQRGPSTGGNQPGMPQQIPNAMHFNNNQPPSAGPQGTPTGGYPNLAPTQAGQSGNTKFPIPKTLQLDPRSQQPVAGPPARPTLANPGMMYNPAIQRPPPYTLEGEGDRVLSKRKLDELVRQVTGAAPCSANESESSSILSPDVEEAMLQTADNFIDEVITSACRLAKLRPNQQLDIRDLQIVLERNYGIRIPGYALDEVRTVRKFQPAPGWHNKMQAVQAGKVMSSRNDS